MSWTEPPVVVCATEPDCLAGAKQIASLAGLPVHDLAKPDAVPKIYGSSQWMLLVKPSQLSLVRPDGLFVEIDFIHGKGTRRSQEANFKSQPLARALGLDKLRKRTDTIPTIIDATAGFGTDGWMMASLGSDVLLLEASSVLVAMLTHALDRARDASPITPSAGKTIQHNHDDAAHRLCVINTDSVKYLTNPKNTGANIIYLDPMYPNTSSKALVKKGMQLLHELIGPDTNGHDLLCAALKKADYRVVVKRPRGAPLLDGSENFTGQITNIQSPHTRFDIYHMTTQTA